LLPPADPPAGAPSPSPPSRECDGKLQLPCASPPNLFAAAPVPCCAAPVVCHRQWPSWWHRFLCCGTGAAQRRTLRATDRPTRTKRSLTARACLTSCAVGARRTPDRPWGIRRPCTRAALAAVPEVRVERARDSSLVPVQEAALVPLKPWKAHRITSRGTSAAHAALERTTVRVEAPRRLRIAAETCRTRPLHTTRGRTHHNLQPAPPHVPALTSACGRVGRAQGVSELCRQWQHERGDYANAGPTMPQRRQRLCCRHLPRPRPVLNG
jgi:hypothetical protein